MQRQSTPSPVIIFVMDVSLLNPNASDWSAWITPRRRETVSRLRQKADRARCIGAGLLLAFALHRHDPALPIPPHPELGWRGKPSLPNVPGFHFNISHSGKWVLCAVGNQPLGIDIELTNRNILNAAGRSLTLDERQHLERLDGQQRQEAATAIWTLKESYAKALGLGLHLPFEGLSLHFQTPGDAPVTMPIGAYAGTPLGASSDTLLGVSLDTMAGSMAKEIASAQASIAIMNRGVPASCALCLVDFPDNDYRVGLCVMSPKLPQYNIENVEWKYFYSDK